MYLNSLGDINSKEQTAEIDLQVLLWWYEPKLNGRQWKEFEGDVQLWQTDIQIDEGIDLQVTGDSVESDKLRNKVEITACFLFYLQITGWPWALHIHAPFHIIQQNIVRPGLVPVVDRH